jgi:hypothetical protein
MPLPHAGKYRDTLSVPLFCNSRPAQPLGVQIIGLAGKDRYTFMRELGSSLSGLPVVPRALGKQVGLGTSTLEQLPKRGNSQQAHKRYSDTLHCLYAAVCLVGSRSRVTRTFPRRGVERDRISYRRHGA